MHMSTNEEPHIEIAKYVCITLLSYCEWLTNYVIKLIL